MNLNLLPLSSFQGFPEVSLSSPHYRASHAVLTCRQIIEDCLQDPGYYITTTRFNSNGELIAAGTASGHLQIYDVMTRGKCFEIRAHAAAITSICWSSNSKYVTCASADWTVSIVDVVERTFVNHEFNSVVLNSVILPKRQLKSEAEPDEMDVDVNDSDYLTVVCSAVGDLPKLLQFQISSDGGISLSNTSNIDFLSAYYSALDSDAAREELIGSLAYCDRSDILYLATSKGNVHLLSISGGFESLQIKISNAPIQSLAISPNDSFFLVNSTDRTLRLYSVSLQLQPSKTINVSILQRYNDAINRIQWNCCGFSSNSEYILAASAGQHNIFIYDRHSSTLQRILEGPKEGCEDLHWHPIRNMLISLSNFGHVYVWTKTLEDNWSAFAPAFIELEDNYEYREREDEFDDIEVRKNSITGKEIIEEREEIVDIASFELEDTFNIQVRVEDILRSAVDGA